MRVYAPCLIQRTPISGLRLALLRPPGSLTEPLIMSIVLRSPETHTSSPSTSRPSRASFPSPFQLPLLSPLFHQLQLCLHFLLHPPRLPSPHVLLHPPFPPPQSPSPHLPLPLVPLLVLSPTLHHQQHQQAATEQRRGYGRGSRDLSSRPGPAPSSSGCSCLGSGVCRGRRLPCSVPARRRSRPDSACSAPSACRRFSRRRSRGERTEPPSRPGPPWTATWRWCGRGHAGSGSDIRCAVCRGPDGSML